MGGFPKLLSSEKLALKRVYIAGGTLDFERTNGLFAAERLARMGLLSEDTRAPQTYHMTEAGDRYLGPVRSAH